MKTWIEIHADNLIHNLSVFRKIAGDRKLLFAVKANAYGHGLNEVVSIVKGAGLVDYYGVDSLSEALAVSRIDNRKKILIMGWLDNDELVTAIRSGFEFVAPSTEFLIRTLHAASETGLDARVHLKVETGTSRLGIDPPDLHEFLKKGAPEGIELKGIYSHFANIEDTTDHSYAMKQLEKFETLLSKIDVKGMLRHFSCSASALLFPETFFDMLRVGVAAYGFWPSKQTFVSFSGMNGKNIKLKPVLEWKAKVAQVKDIKRGTPVSYGLTYKTLNRSKIVVIPVGYCDGYDRKLSNISSVLIRGRGAPVRGRVCMNMFMADATHINNVKEGEIVTLIGKNKSEMVTVDGLAELAGTINYEFVSRLNPLIPRLIV